MIKHSLPAPRRVQVRVSDHKGLNPPSYSMPAPKICRDCGYETVILEDFIGHRVKKHHVASMLYGVKPSIVTLLDGRVVEDKCPF